jgi:Helix-turn-helix
MDVEEKVRRRREFFELFKRSGWTQAETARELGGVSRANINGIITGEQTPGAALLDLFRVRVEQIEMQSRHPGATVAPPGQMVDDLLLEMGKLREQMVAVEWAARRLKTAGSGRSHESNTAAPASAPPPPAMDKPDQSESD